MQFSERDILRTRVYDPSYGKPLSHPRARNSVNPRDAKLLHGRLGRPTNRPGNYARVSQKFPRDSFGSNYIFRPARARVYGNLRTARNYTVIYVTASIVKREAPVLHRR